MGGASFAWALCMLIPVSYIRTGLGPVGRCVVCVPSDVSVFFVFLFLSRSAILFGRALCTPHYARMQQGSASAACLRAASQCRCGLPFSAIGGSHPWPHPQSVFA